jgi:hypothetical protein
MLYNSLIKPLALSFLRVWEFIWDVLPYFFCLVSFPHIHVLTAAIANKLIIVINIVKIIDNVIPGPR